MSMISYAQNFEDIMIWRCFGHLEKGFYIDLGAQDPVIDSVTKTFYDKGWTGINVEPTEPYFLRLKAERPRDINIQIAIAETKSVIDFWILPSTGLSTGIKTFADKHESAGFEVRKVSVETNTLSAVCEEFAEETIHFMKIDVEGFEEQVLRSANFIKYRPMLIIVESNEPNTVVENYIYWEHILLNHDYQFCYADGLNRFYLSNEASYLSSNFKYPPNVFDNFMLHTDSRLR